MLTQNSKKQTVNKTLYTQVIQLSFPNLTDCLKVAEGTLGTALVHHISQREQSECITLLEDGIVWLVDGHDHYSVVDVAQAMDSKTSESDVIVKFKSNRLELLLSAFLLCIIVSSLQHHYMTLRSSFTSILAAMAKWDMRRTWDRGLQNGNLGCKLRRHGTEDPIQ